MRKPLPSLLLALAAILSAPAADPVAPATAASLRAAAESLARLAAGDLAALDAYAHDPARKEGESEAAVAKMKAGYPPGVEIRLIPDGAIESAGRADFDLRLVRDGTGMNLVAIRTAANGPRHALLLPAAQFVAAALETASLAWPAQTLLAGRGRVVFPPDQDNYDLSWIDLDKPAPGEKSRISPAGGMKETLVWSPLALGPQAFFWLERRESAPPPPPVVTTAAVRAPEPVLLPAPTLMPIQPRPEPVVEPEPTPAPGKPEPPAVPPEDPAPAVAVAPATFPSAATLPPPPRREPVAPAVPVPDAAPAPDPVPPVEPKPAPVAPVEPMPAVVPAPTPDAPPAAEPIVPAPAVAPAEPAGPFQGIWSGAYMETGDPNTYKMRAEIRQTGGACEVHFVWGDQKVVCAGTITGDTVEAAATKPAVVRLNATHFPDRDALKGSLTFDGGGKVRSFYLLRLKDLP